MSTANDAGRLGVPTPRRVTVLRALQLGDMLCAVPALRSLRRALPDSEIVLIGLPWAREFALRFDRYLDGFLEFPGFPGLPEKPFQVERFPDFLSQTRDMKLDLAVQMHGSGSFVNPLTVLLGARNTAGFYTPGEYCPDPMRYLAWPGHGLEIRRLLRLTQFLGCPDAGEDLEFPLHEDDFRRLGATGDGLDLDGHELACIHPGASVFERRWPASRFAAVGRSLIARGLRVVLTGSRAERALTEQVGRELGGPFVNLAGRTDLGALAALLSRARVLVSNDTGVAHLAVAVGTPGVIISTGENPSRWAPIDGRRYRVLCDASAPGVGVGDVLAQTDQLLGTVPSRVGQGSHPGPGFRVKTP